MGAEFRGYESTARDVPCGGLRVLQLG